MKKILSVVLCVLLSRVAALAQFDPVNPMEPSISYKVQLSSVPDGVCWFSGAGKYKPGASVTVSVSSRYDNYHFDYWELDGSVYSRERSFIYKVETRDVHFVAHYTFEPANPSEPEAIFRSRLYLESKPEGVASFNYDNGQLFMAGTSIYVIPYANSGYKFQGWYSGDEKVGDSPQLNWTIGKDNVRLTAHYAFDPDSPDDPSYEGDYVAWMTVISSDDELGTVMAEGLNADGQVVFGNYVTLTAQCKHEDVKFVGWWDGHDIVSREAEWRFMVHGRLQQRYTAIFSEMEASEGNIVSLKTSDGKPGEVVEAVLSLANSDDVVAAEFRIPLGDNLRYVEGSLKKNQNVLNSHTVTASEVDGYLRVYLFSNLLSPLPPQIGRLLSFQLKLGRRPEVVDVTPKAKLSSAEAKAYPVFVQESEITIYAPQIEVTPMVINYGEVVVGGDYPQSITIKNTGTSLVNLSQPAVSSTDFVLTGMPATLEPNASATLRLNYHPNAGGEVAEIIKFSSDAVNGPQVVTLAAKPYMRNVLQIGSARGETGEEVEVPVSVSNMEPLSAIQFSLPLPEGVTYVAGSFVQTARLENMRTFTSVENGALKVYIYSEGGACLSKGEGTIGAFRLHLNAAGGCYPLVPASVVLGGEALTNVLTYAESGELKVACAEIDGASTWRFDDCPVTGVATGRYTLLARGESTLIINKVLLADERCTLTTALPLEIPAGTTADLELNYAPSEAGEYECAMQIYSNDPMMGLMKVMVSGRAYEPNALSVSASIEENGYDYTLDIRLDNYSSIAAVQFELACGADFACTDATLTSRMDGFEMPSVIKLADGRYRIVVYSLAGATLEPGSGTLLTLWLKQTQQRLAGQEIGVSNILLSNPAGANVNSAATTACTLDRRSCKLTYVVDGELYAEYDVECGTEITPIPEPERAGCSFTGWDEVPERMPAYDVEVNGYFTTTGLPAIVNAPTECYYYLNGYQYNGPLQKGELYIGQGKKNLRR